MSDTDTPQGENEPTEANAALAPVDPMADKVERALRTGEVSDLLGEELTPEENQRAIVERILRAQTVDEVLASFEATPLDAVLDQPMEVYGVRWQQSEFEQGNPFYALIDAVILDGGERVTLTTGATNVLAQLLKAAKERWFPMKVVARQSAKPTKSGYLPKHLERAQ